MGRVRQGRLQTRARWLSAGLWALLACGGAGSGADDGSLRDLPVPETLQDGGAEGLRDLSTEASPADVAPDPGPGDPDAREAGPDLPKDLPEEDPGGMPDAQTGDAPSGVHLEALDRPGEVLTGTSGPDGRAWLAGRDGLVLRSDGDDFWPVRRPAGARDITGISAFGGVVFAVDSEGGIFRWRDGEGWTAIRQADGKALRGIAAISEEEFWAVGDGGRVFHGTGEAVREDPTGISYDLFGVQATREGTVRAVGRYGTLLTRGGAAWERTTIGLSSSTLRAIWRSGDGRMVVVGDRGVVVRHDGVSWKLDLTNETRDPPRDLHAVFGVAADEVFAVGEDGAIFRFDGKRWSLETVSGPYGVRLPLRALVVRKRTDGSWAWTTAGMGPQGLDRTEDGWRDRTLGIRNSFFGVGRTPDGGVVAVGERGLIAFWRREEAIWAIRAPEPRDLVAVAWPLVVGEAGTLLRLRQGQADPLAPVGDADLTDLVVGSRGTFIADRVGRVWRWDEEGAVLWASLPDPIRAVAETDGALWVGGENGRLQVDTGEGFRLVPTGALSALRDLLALPGEEVIAVGDHGLVLECDPSGCRRVFEDPATFLYALGTFGGVPIAAGWAGILLRRDPDGSWQSIESGTRRVFRGITDLEDGGAVLVGLDGTFGRLDPRVLGAL